MSKVKISKAIHNAKAQTSTEKHAVVNMSKVKISKAIHNSKLYNTYFSKLLSICQR